MVGLNPNFGKFNVQQGLLNQPLNLEPPQAVGGDIAGAKPAAVWIGEDIGDGEFSYIEKDGGPRPGDVVLTDDAAYRLCVSPDGEQYWAKTTVQKKDFEANRGDIRG